MAKRRVKSINYKFTSYSVKSKTQLIKASKECGSHFFARGTMRFFASRVSETGVFPTPNGAIFVTSEQFRGSTGNGPRKYSVREFNAKTCNMKTAGKFQKFADRRQAIESAKRLAKRRNGR